MNIKQTTMISLFLFSVLTIAGCCGMHHGKSGCNKAGEHSTCSQQGQCNQSVCNKPCCEKMKGATPAQ